MSCFPSRLLLTACVVMAGACGTPPRSGATADARDSIADLESPEACRYADSAWHCRIAPEVRVRFVPVYSVPPHAAGPVILQALQVLPETRAAGRDSVEISRGEAVGRLTEGDLTVVDLDRDGYGDLLLRHQFGIAANEGDYIWRYRPALRRFVYDSVLSEEVNVTADSVGCVRTVASIGSGQLEKRFCLSGPTWIEVWRQTRDYDTASDRMVEKEYVRKGDSLVLVRSN